MPRVDIGAAPTSRICVGVTLTSDPSGTRARLGAFCEALSAATGLEVVPRTVWHYYRLLESMEMGDVHVAWLPPIVALRAAARRRIHPIALPVRNGVCSYSSALFTRKDSDIHSLADLGGVRAAWVDRQSAAGYLVIRARLKADGLDLERAFASDTFLGAYDAVARAVLEGESDVGASFAYFDEQMHPRTAGWGDAPVRVLAHAGPIPSDIIAVGVRVPSEVVNVIQQALLSPTHTGLHTAARGLLGSEGFVLPTREHLDPLAALLPDLEDTTQVQSASPGR